MHDETLHSMGGLVIGQTWDDGSHGAVRVVAIDPHLHFVEAEDLAGDLVLDTIEHFTTTRHALPRAG
jgi:hypothetical protein